MYGLSVMTLADTPPPAAAGMSEPAGEPSLPPGTTILQVIPALGAGGAERGCVDVAAAVTKAGGRAVVVSEGGPLVRELDRAGAKHVTLPVASKNPWTIRLNANRLADVIRSEGAEIVHARSRAPAWSALWAARATGTPFVTTVHAPYSARNRLKRWYNSVMAKGDRVIAISGYVARYVQVTYGVPSGRLRLVHRGIDMVAFSPERVSAERIIRLARTWQLPDGAPVVMLPGRLTRWKGATVLIDAMARLGRDDAVCLLVGDDQGRNAFREELEQRVRDRGLQGRVRLVGNCDDMPAAYMLADAVVSASTDPEAFGRVIVEAQAMGRPTVVSDVGAVDETVDRGRSGWIVPPGDPQALAAALDEVLAMGAEAREALAQAAAAHVRHRFDRRTMTAQTLAIYRELLRPG
jgi:glycosyltransferase involved in cell wall biosynthesis